MECQNDIQSLSRANPLKLYPCPACRPPSLQHEAAVRQRADHPGRPGVSSVSRFRQFDGRVQKGQAAGGRRTGPDDEASLRT